MKGKTIYERALKRWGEELQINVLGEECGELDHLVHKYMRLKGLDKPIPDSLYFSMCEEIADVLIMIKQFELIKPSFPCTIKSFIQQKLTRVKKRLDDEDKEAKNSQEWLDKHDLDIAHGCGRSSGPKEAYDT